MMQHSVSPDNASGILAGIMGFGTVVMNFIRGLPWDDLATIVGLIIGIIALTANIYFKMRHDRRETAKHQKYMDEEC